MIAVLIANLVLILLALGIGGGILPVRTFSGAIAALHKTVGITLPTPDKERIVGVIWLVSALLIGDGILFLLVVLARSVGRS